MDNSKKLMAMAQALMSLTKELDSGLPDLSEDKKPVNVKVVKMKIEPKSGDSENEMEDESSKSDSIEDLKESLIPEKDDEEDPIAKLRKRFGGK